MKLKGSFKILLFGMICCSAFNGCEKEFDYGKKKDAVKTLEVTAVSQTTAKVSGNVVSDNGAALTERGICYGIDDEPTINGLRKADTSAKLGNFSCILNTLNPSTTYYARAYATNNFGTAYGNSISFKTQAATVPILSSTIAANQVAFNSANSGGIITHAGASPVTSRGICWSSTVTVPTITGTRTNDGTGTGQFVSSLSNLTPNTLYYIRAYATNSLGTAYADVKTFTTSPATAPAGVTTTTISGITHTTSIGGGNITSDGGAAITARGVCWSNGTATPTISNSRTIDGTGIGAYTSVLTGLVSGTTYYVRAYATNAIGTSYGATITFTTLIVTIPVGVTTSTLSSITQTTAVGGGTIANDGGSPVTVRGVCWSDVTSSPTTANSRTVNGAGVGGFSSSLTGLLPGRTYYVRAFATNSSGTAYGTAMVFTTTASTIPIGVTTSAVTSITQNTAVTGGNIAGDGGAAVTSRGVCWSNATSSPTIANSTTNNGTGIGSFTSSITGLNANTTYYVRAYATNSTGTAYGATVTFTTLPNLTVGSSYQGGIIAYIFVPGDAGYIAGQTHGLIATTTNQSTGAQWGCSGVSISGTSTVLSTGQANTNAIVTSCGTAGIAARICNDLVSGGFSDWYLPSRDELNKLYLNRSLIGSFSNVAYWSSSQATSTTSWSINFSNGAFGTITKNSGLYVRGIRTF